MFHRSRVILPATLLAGVLLAVSALPPASADSNDSCRNFLSLDGKLRTGADPKQVAAACLAAAANDNPQSLYMAGLVLEQGIGGNKDSLRAEDWYRKAAKKGQPLALLAMGRLAEARHNNDAALSWYAAAALKKNADAEAALMRLKVRDPKAMYSAAEWAINLDDSLGGRDDFVGSGSGIVLDDYIVLTNEHVVDGCDRMAVAPGLPAKVLARDADLDLAVLKTTVRAGAIAPLAAQAEIDLEMPLTTGGYPGIGAADPTFVITEGKRSSRNIGREDEKYWRLSNRIDPGNSGGPLLDSGGLVRGVVFASLPVTGIVKKSAPKGGHEGMAIRLDTVKGFLDQHGIAYSVAATGPVGTAADMEDHVAAITVLVECFRR